jgi:hypothetical protein
MATSIGVLIVVETDAGIVMVHPPGAPAGAPASLPSAIVPMTDPAAVALVIVREQTGLDVEVHHALNSFVQEGTPAGTIQMYPYVARVVGGDLSNGGAEGPARTYPVNELPAIVPVRVANQRALAAYLEWLGREPTTTSSIP